MKKLDVVTVDSFTKIPFAGNPAAVCVLNENLSDEVMKKISREMNLSETSFVKPIDGKANTFLLRWLTPKIEVGLCGHATLATAHVLFEKYSNLLDDNCKEVFFETVFSGDLSVKKEDNDLLVMNFPQNPPEKVEIDQKILEILAVVMNFPVEHIKDLQYCKKTKKLLVSILDDILNASPDFQTLEKINFGLEPPVAGVSLNTNDSDEYDVVSRYFTPWNGINEDPVNGSSHTILSVYWSQKLNKKKLKVYQASSRGGEMETEILENGRVALKGYAVTVMEGILKF